MSVVAEENTLTLKERAETGFLMAENLERIISGIAKERVKSKEIGQLNGCFAPSHPEPEFTGYVEDSQTFRELKKVAELLRNDPTTRSFVVDNDKDSHCTEDGIWLSIPKWEAELGLPSVHWHIVTVRSIENRVFRETFPAQDDWKTTHQSGPFGTTHVSKERDPLSRVFTRRHAEDDRDKNILKRQCGALFSDQPRMVALYGTTVGKQLWKVAKQRACQPKVVLRLFRCAPRASLTEHIARIANDERTDNVFDIWIRHPEMPERTLGGFGTYAHSVHAHGVTLLEKLTSLRDVPEDCSVNGSVCSTNQSFTTARLEESSGSTCSWRSLTLRHDEDHDLGYDSEDSWDDLIPTHPDISEVEETESSWDTLPPRQSSRIFTPPLHTIDEKVSPADMSQDLPWTNVLRRVI